ncbi:MAG TPA: 4'-phosphopantetheinyl transferase superfamily protein [Oligoflexus sp.]|uniref:4'-phosphopantetheinyl transferase superfamily protein n=1 Tax=Oligoflexus sp. TaxID=1971216 RepID=UPI002D39AE3E|nr:4'-phosphopantetheinyl transferase superfamily protein [Oligoflexus sp.]HYX39772.1 4'-phosphopantetheinyl transferase superfamily protein [Oligoflexus sp.]
MRLGNDIVDRTATADHNPRFIDRILHPEEKSRRSSWTLDDPLLWIHWACKEAAYKAIRQSRDIPFHHREFILTPDLSMIHYHQECLQLQIRQEDQAVFALATDAALKDCHSRIFAFDTERGTVTQSEKVRSILLDLATEILQLPLHELTMTTAQRIPRICHRGQVLPLPVSLTHHGRYVAASFATPTSSTRP